MPLSTRFLMIKLYPLLWPGLQHITQYKVYLHDILHIDNFKYFCMSNTIIARIRNHWHCIFIWEWSGNRYAW